MSYQVRNSMRISTEMTRERALEYGASLARVGASGVQYLMRDGETIGIITDEGTLKAVGGYSGSLIKSEHKG